jgi:hypothetical protein
MRLWSKRLAHDVARGRVDLDWVEPPRGFYGMVERRRLKGARFTEGTVVMDAQPPASPPGQGRSARYCQ